MSGPRVGFGVLRFFHERTGNVESLLNLVTGLKELGVEVSLLLPRSTPLAAMFGGFDVRFYAERARFDANVLATERALVRACAEMRGRVDLLQLQLPSPAFARVAEHARQASGLPVVAAFESGYHHRPAVPWPAPGKTLLSLLLRRALNDRLHAHFTRFAFDACVVASEYQRRELQDAGCTTPVHVMANATTFERFAQPPVSDAAWQIVPATQRTIAYIGHFNFIKGVTHLIAAFARLAARHPDLHLLIVGSGRGNESEAVRNAVAALGARASLIERTVDVAGLLHRIDVLALPYVASYGHQLFPNLVLESLAAGVALVTSDIPPVNEIVREGDTGYLARPGDPASLALAIERALDASSTRREMQERQRSLCRDRFDYRVVARRYLELYRKLIA